jgi:hypothetical protein
VVLLDLQPLSQIDQDRFEDMCGQFDGLEYF